MFSQQPKLTLGPILILTLIQVTISCNNSSSTDLKAYWLLNETMTSSIEFISTSNSKLYLELDLQVKDPPTSYFAKRWQPKALQVKRYSNEMIAYIEGLKNDILHEAGMKNRIELDSSRGKNLDHSSMIFHDKIWELVDKLTKFRNDVFRTDSIEDETVKAKFEFLKAEDAGQKRFDGLEQELALKIPAIAALALLSKCQYVVRQIEHYAVNYYFMSTTNDAPEFDRFSAFVIQNSMVFSSGDSVEIIAGIGCFNLSSKPEVFINGKAIEVTPDGTAIYQVKVPDKKGKYVIPVRVRYHDSFGQVQEVYRNARYQVIGD